MPSFASTALTLAAIVGTTSAAPAKVHDRSVPTGSPVVTVKNGSYYGIHNDNYNQDFFLGIPYSQAPVGDLRFSKPEPLDTTWEELRAATEYQPKCYGYGSDSDGFEQSEDCLFINIVRPSGYEDTQLPLALWIHGGGFYMGGATDDRYNLTFIVENSVAIGKPIMAASIAYRLSAFGYLNSEEVAETGSLNAGLKDQRLALHWIQENIGAFGADPEKVTIWGESAGALSVGFHLVAYGGRNDKLFRAAVMESGNPIFYTSLNQTSDFQPIYDDMVEDLGCSGKDSLACIKALDVEKIDQLLKTKPAYQQAFLPAIDGVFVANYTSQQLASGDFVHVPIIDGTNSDEGTLFSPMGIDTEDQLKEMMSTTSFLQPGLPAALVEKLMAVYTTDEYNMPNDLSFGSDDVLGMPFGEHWRHSASYYGDHHFIAARRLTCQTWAAAGLDAYCFRFDTVPRGLGWPFQAAHFQEVSFVFNNVDGLGYSPSPFLDMSPAFAQLSNHMSKTWASFVADLNPNSWKGVDAALPLWPTYDNADPKNFVFSANETCYTETDDFRAEGIKLFNDNTVLFRK
ncbi:hypothetical protein AAFC00_005646 [Neodothiora populina]|uniref:Carboxylesterase type B domain-containing protein n=1 Tax=Neodothiora populina TaxID=2781224 RepID=A0ABR3PLJ1_9PEZI